MDLLLQNVPQYLAERLLNKNYAEVAFRTGKERFELLEKFLVKKIENNQDGGEMEGALGKFNIAI